MGRLIVVNHVTLDGVMQAPARPDEDRRGGFDRGGWAAANADPVMGETMGTRMTGDGELLLGRRTYEDMASVWPHRPAEDPYAAVINALRLVDTVTTGTGVIIASYRPASWSLTSGTARRARPAPARSRAPGGSCRPSRP